MAERTTIPAVEDVAKVTDTVDTSTDGGRKISPPQDWQPDQSAEGGKAPLFHDEAPKKNTPIKFKDALGRKYSFPFDLVKNWQVSRSQLLV